MISQHDHRTEASIASMEGQGALSRGDTDHARECFKRAAKLLEDQVKSASKTSEKQLLRFLAASQYFKGGLYEEALKLCRKIDKRLLPKNVQHLYPAFLRDVQTRSSPKYEGEFRFALVRAYRQPDPQKVLELLKNEPFILSPAALAFTRAVACEDLKDYRAAALFFAKAHSLQPHDLESQYVSAALPLQLMGQPNREDEVAEYIAFQLQYLPVFSTFITASLLNYYRKSKAASPNEARGFARQQISYFEQARTVYQTKAEMYRSHPELRELLMLGFNSAPFGYIRLGEKQKALEICDEAVALSPMSPWPYTMRGLMTYPAERANSDFRQAVDLKDPSYTPYYYLAHDALKRSEYDEAIRWAESAIERQPSPSIEAQLCGWIAIAKDELGFSREVVKEWFQRARDLESSPEIEQNYLLFQSRGAATNGHLGYDFNPPPEPLNHPLNLFPKSNSLDRTTRDRMISQTLSLVGA